MPESAAVPFDSRFDAIRRVTDELAATAGLDELCRLAVELGRERLGFERLSIWLVEPDRGCARGTFGVDEQGCVRDERNQTLALTSGTFVELAGSGEAVVRQAHPLRDSQGRVVGHGSAASVLLRHEGRVVGVLHTDRLLSGQPLTTLDGSLLALYGCLLGLLVGVKSAELARQEGEASFRAQSHFRQKAEESLRRLAAALEQTSEGVVITDLEGVVVFANRAFERMSGYSVDEVLGRSIGLVRSGQHGAAFYERMWEALKSGRVWQGQIINRHRDGTLYREEATITPIRDDCGQIVNFVSVKRDISHQTRLEEQLRQAAKMEAVGQLAGGVAHDFNNLLTTIQGYADMLQLELPEGSQRQDVQQILAAAERAGTLTRQLLAFSRRQLIEPVQLDLNEVVSQIETMLRRTLGERIRLETRLNASPARVCADRGQLDQLLINLAVNARDAMPAGGRLSIEVGERRFEADEVEAEASLAPGAYVELRVEDTGCGMTSEVRDRIYEPFFTTKPSGQGTGLGLSMVYGIVKQNGGEIRCESECGRGTTFSVYLPQAAEAPALAEPEPVPPEGPARGARVLLVEDEPGLRALAWRVLETYGYQVTAAGDAEEALALAEEAEPFDLLLTDVVMPGLNGRQLAERLTGRWPKVRVLFMSGYAEPAIANEGLLPEGTVLLPKPFGIGELVRTVRRVIESDAPSAR